MNTWRMWAVGWEDVTGAEHREVFDQYGKAVSFKEAMVKQGYQPVLWEL